MSLKYFREQIYYGPGRKIRGFNISNYNYNYNVHLVAGERSAREPQPLSGEVTPLASVALVDSLDLGPEAAADSAPAAEQKEETEEEQRTARADELADIDDVRHLK